jgi:hypothetical protein
MWAAKRRVVEAYHYPLESAEEMSWIDHVLARTSYIPLFQQLGSACFHASVWTCLPENWTERVLKDPKPPQKKSYTIYLKINLKFFYSLHHIYHFHYYYYLNKKWLQNIFFFKLFYTKYYYIFFSHQLNLL